MITEDELRACLPDVTSEMTLDGIRASVDVYRDPWGIPHIKAGSEEDLYFAQGYVTAQDRLWHMDADRFRALGRWSECVGEAGIAQDKLLRAAGMGRTAKLDYEVCSDAAKQMLDAYTAGVNAFCESTDVLPIEYKLLDTKPEKWESWHCITVYKMRNSLLGTFEPKLLRTRMSQDPNAARAFARVLTGYPEGHLVTVPPGAEWQGEPLNGLDELLRAAEDANWTGETDAGSNAWSISGKLTVSGKPLVGGDSHRGLDTPSVYYQAHISCPDFSMIGYTVPGVPGVMHFCHNDHVAWGMTYGSADTQDLYIERFRDSVNGREYEFEGDWKSAEVLNERIEVRDGQAVDFEVTVTHHGPVIAGDPAEGHGVAIADPGLREGTLWVDAARDAMLSKSVDELHTAFANWTDRVNNYAVADVDGNFGYIHEGKIPIRDEANGWRAVPGYDGQHEWRGYIPHDELPKSINPETGYAITCNQRVAEHDYPYYVGVYFTPEYRGRRVQSRILQLEAGQSTVEDMGRIHAERLSLPARRMVIALDGATSEDATVHQALSYLRAWDCRMDREDVAPSIYAEMRSHLTILVTRAVFGDQADTLLSGASGADGHLRYIALATNVAIEKDDTSLLPDGMRWQDALLDSLTKACDALTVILGSEITEWFWGRLHRTRPTHPLSSTFPEAAEQLDPPSLGLHGDGDTPLAASFAINSRYTVSGLSVNRYIHDPSNWSNSRWIVPLGASGHPGSPHYADQAEMHADVAFIPQLWEWDEIAEQAETRQVLKGKADH
jgi:penicillin G amidase